MFKIIFIFMLLFLALGSLTTLNHLFLNQFITEHRDTFSLTKKSRGNASMSFTHITEWQIKDDNVGHCFSDIYWQIIAGQSFQIFMGKS